MWQRPRSHDDPFRTPSPEPPSSVTYKWATQVARPSRFSGLRISPFRIGIILVALGGLILLQNWIQISYRVAQPFTLETYNTTTVPHAAFQPPESGSYRSPDTIDTFQSYKFRDTCDISSLDLHAAFSPLCYDRAAMLTAMSNGGRIGHDAPYMPRGCDMRWFTSEEVCAILGRFDKVVIIGDSMLRHVTGSINILVRKDIGYGAVTDWNFSAQERRECFCNDQFDVKACSVQGIYKTADILAHDAESVSCSDSINVIMEEIVRVPIPPDEINRLKTSIGDQTERRKAFIFGHGLWSDLDRQKTVDWLDTILRTIRGMTGSDWHGLFVTPNAAGKGKPDQWIVSQGNKALMLYEEAIGIEVAKRGIEHLGTWNMSIQANKYDGVHLDMRGNLVKAMMVLNWLNLLDD